MFKKRKIIDCHMHTPYEAQCFDETARANGFNFTKQGIIETWKKSNIAAGICMGVTETKQGAFPDKNASNPMMPTNLDLPDNMFFCLGVNPYKQSAGDLDRFDKALENEKAVGMKVYGGYYPEYAYSDIYKPFYKLAEKHKVPVAVHLADLFAPDGGLKYAQPLTMDELARKYPDINFVLCHMGEPWCMDAAVVIARNKNVYGDLSGLLPGNRKNMAKVMKIPAVTARWEQAVAFLQHFGYDGGDEQYGSDCLKKLMFGTDYPLLETQPYIEFIEKLIPKQSHDTVFSKTALKVYPKLAQGLESQGETCT